MGKLFNIYGGAVLGATLVTLALFFLFSPLNQSACAQTCPEPTATPTATPTPTPIPSGTTVILQSPIFPPGNVMEPHGHPKSVLATKFPLSRTETIVAIHVPIMKASIAGCNLHVGLYADNGSGTRAAGAPLVDVPIPGDVVGWTVVPLSPRVVYSGAVIWTAHANRCGTDADVPELAAEAYCGALLVTDGVGEVYFSSLLTPAGGLPEAPSYQGDHCGGYDIRLEVLR